MSSSRGREGVGVAEVEEEEEEEAAAAGVTSGKRRNTAAATSTTALRKRFKSVVPKEEEEEKEEKKKKNYMRSRRKGDRLSVHHPWMRSLAAATNEITPLTLPTQSPSQSPIPAAPESAAPTTIPMPPFWPNRTDIEGVEESGGGGGAAAAASRGGGNNTRTADGTLTIIVLLTVTLCFIWSPGFFRRCGPRRDDERRRSRRSGRDRGTQNPSLSVDAAAAAAARAAEEDMIRVFLESGGGALWGGAGGVGNDDNVIGPHGVSLEDRRDFVSNVLVTKKVLSSAETTNPIGRKKSDIILPQRPSPLPPLSSSPLSPPNTALGGGEPSSSLPPPAHPPQQEELAPAPAQPPPPPLTDEEAGCAICMEEYKEGDEICWSHNELCTHAFHRDCIIDWLIRHDDCPFCRHNFLSLDDGESVTSKALRRRERGGGGGGGGGNGDDFVAEAAVPTITNSATAEGGGNSPLRVPPTARSENEQDISAFHRGMALLAQFSRDTNRRAGSEHGAGEIAMTNYSLGGAENDEAMRVVSSADDYQHGGGADEERPNEQTGASSVQSAPPVG